MGRTKPNQSPNSGHAPVNYGVQMEQTPATYPPKTEQTPSTYPPVNYGVETEQTPATYPPANYVVKTEQHPATYPPAEYGAETEHHPATYPPAHYEMEQSPEVYHPASPHSSYEDYEQPQRPPPAQVYENQNYPPPPQQQQQQQQPVQWPPAAARAYPPEAGYEGRRNDQGVAYGQPEQAVQWPPVQGVATQNNLNIAGRSPAGFTATQQGMQESSPYPFIAGNQWSTQLFDFETNSDLAVLTAFAPCVTFGQITEILDEGQTSCALGSLMYSVLMPILSCALAGTLYRQRLREKYNLIQHPAEDWILHLFCPCCALCQEYRELQIRGIDPSQGWLGYLAQQQQKQGLPTASPMMQTMQR